MFISKIKRVRLTLIECEDIHVYIQMARVRLTLIQCEDIHVYPNDTCKAHIDRV